MILGDLVYEVKSFVPYLVCVVLLGHDWRPYSHWEFDIVGGGYVCERCKHGRVWSELSRFERQAADDR